MVGSRGNISRQISASFSQVDKRELKEFEIVLSLVGSVMDDSPKEVYHLQPL